MKLPETVECVNLIPVTTEYLQKKHKQCAINFIYLPWFQITSSICPKLISMFEAQDQSRDEYKIAPCTDKFPHPV